MKKLLYSLVIVALVLTAVSACRNKNLQTMTALVKHIEVHHDTLKTMTVCTNADGDTMLLRLDGTRFQRGMVMPGDSAIVNYLEGKDGNMYAVIVTLLPKVEQPHYATPSDTLLTRPAEPAAKADSAKAK